MDNSTLMAVLTFGTLGAVLVFALVSMVRISRRQRSNTRKSTLAADAPNTTPPGEKSVDT